MRQEIKRKNERKVGIEEQDITKKQTKKQKKKKKEKKKRRKNERQDAWRNESCYPVFTWTLGTALALGLHGLGPVLAAPDGLARPRLAHGLVLDAAADVAGVVSVGNPASSFRHAVELCVITFTLYVCGGKKKK